MKLGIRELIFIMLMLGLLGGGYYFVFKPASQKRADRLAEINMKKKALADLRHATAGIPDLERKINEIQAAIRFFESKLPQEREVDTILKEVWQRAEANGLQTRTIKTLKTERMAGYSELPINIVLAGDFNGFYDFLLQLEKLSRITRVNQMKLQKITNRDGAMEASLTLSVFFESGAGSMRLADVDR